MLTKEDRSEKIRKELFQEFYSPEQKITKSNKSSNGLSKRAKFLADPRNKQQPGEKSLYEMDPMKRKGQR